jgi:hypothetical protein
VQYGAISPLAFTSFLSRFRDRQALGLIATSFPVPVVFGSRFGRRFIARYLDGESLGDAIFDLRREFLHEGNPFALFYSLQCPLDACGARKPKS